MKIKMSEFRAMLFISIVVSGFIYSTYGNTGVVKSQLDMICFTALVLLPFILPVYSLFISRRNKKIC